MSTLDGSPKLERQVKKFKYRKRHFLICLLSGSEILPAGFTKNCGHESFWIFPALEEHCHQDIRDCQRRHLHPHQV